MSLFRATPGQLKGRSLLLERFLYPKDSEFVRFNQTEMLGWVEGGWKLIRHLGRPAGTELFDLDNDPTERNDLHDVDRTRASRMRRDMADYLERLNRRRSEILQGIEPTSRLPDPETLERLRSLGYVR